MVPETTGRRPGDENPNASDADARGPHADPHTRLIVDYLQGADGPVEVPTLATEVAAALTGTPPESVQRNVRRRVQTWFHHGQLPALEEAGVVEYDPGRGVVRLDGEGEPDEPGGNSRGRT